MFDICIIGHVTKDIVRIKDVVLEMPGGVAYYFAIGSKNLGLNVSIITKIAKKDENLLKNLVKNDVAIFCRESPSTTIFENIYPTNFDFRIQKVNSIARPFSMGDVQEINAQIFHFGPLTKDDIPLEILKRLSRKAIISLDIQGFLRNVEMGKVINVDWDEKDEGLAYVDILKANEMEARIATGETNMKKAAAKLSSHGINEIVITLGAKGSLIYSENKFYAIPSFPVSHISDTTGCGDTYMAGYIYKRLKSFDIGESGRFAAAMASLKIGKMGPFEGSEEYVKKFLAYHKIFE
jgi:sugar/nucleoside kinase (ribokinase family)